jgi:hypothetical protein
MVDNPFKKAIAARNQQPSVEPEPIIEPFPADKAEGRGQKGAGNRRGSTRPATLPEPTPEPEPEPQTRKRGRPATGKRSDDEWIGRTFYVRRDTDLDVEMQLIQLKRQGIDVDKSELVEILLSAWVKWQQGKDLEIHLSEISPIQKGETRKSKA